MPNFDTMNASEKKQPLFPGARQILDIILVLVFASIFVQCRSLSYYEQAIDGQMEILQKQQSISELIENPKTPTALREKLVLIQSARTFAEKELLLPVNDHYLSYVELNRPYVVWNVFAAPEFSLAPETWCFPIAGCVNYRGYFKEADARRFGDALAQKGFDVYIGGAIAYSTLGWFDDPVLSTFINLSASDTVALIFHELAHGLLYVPDDTAFNESFATAVEQEGLKRWQLVNNPSQGYTDWQRKRRYRRKFTDLVSKYRTQLGALYASSLPANAKRDQKAAVFNRMYLEFSDLKSNHPEMAVYSAWFNRPLNNAQLISVSTYHDWVPAFSKMLSDSRGDLEKFYEKCRQLAKKAPQERHRILTDYHQNAHTALQRTATGPANSQIVLHLLQ
ncbi:MAG: aminopeptidase [Desulfobacterales bacterium]|jgi:predicted aminopeptidase